MLAGHDLIAFVVVKDLTRARAFYEGVLGLPLAALEGPTAVYDANGTILRVSVGPHVPVPYTVVGWVVEDIGSAVGALGAKGVALERFEGMAQDALGVWTAPDGTKVAWFKDPDGNVLSLTEWADRGPTDDPTAPRPASDENL